MLIVQKYGGATLSTPEKVKKVARRIESYIREGHRVVAIVSAMGKTTNELLSLANQVSSQPSLRELDMLLTTGERISMSLVSMALNDLGIPAISYTGSQAGVLTNDSHVNALITDVKAFRVAEAIAEGKVVVLAGFQGVSPTTKEITTLGRGGTDTTAVAMACYLKADRCEIVKDVAGVFSADPNFIEGAFNLPKLSYEQMADMTFGGAKVVHYRAIELAARHKMDLWIGPMENIETEGTQVIKRGSLPMYEKVAVVSLNSFDKVLILRGSAVSASEFLKLFREGLQKFQVADPQVLHFEANGQALRETTNGNSYQLMISGPSEILEAIESRMKDLFEIDGSNCLITATCNGTASPELSAILIDQLNKIQVSAQNLWLSALSVFMIVPQADRKKALQSLHELVQQ